MPTYIIQCPYCHTIKKVTQNMSFKCQNCNATIFIDNNGKVKHSTSHK